MNAIIVYKWLLQSTRSQLWINTHSIGMMSRAKELQAADPSKVIFLDFADQDFDASVTLRPIVLTREFWKKILAVALDDFAKLIAPKEIVLCEGPPVATPGRAEKGEFDASCYKVIFASTHPDTDFMGVGNNLDVVSDRLAVGNAIQTLVTGTKVIRVIDRDERTPNEVAGLVKEGVRVLSRRHLEAFLLDDEVLSKLCREKGLAAKIPDVLAVKAAALSASVARSNASDDVKSAAGTMYTEIRRVLGLTSSGSTAQTFMRDVLAPLISPDMKVFADLQADIFKS